MGQHWNNIGLMDSLAESKSHLADATLVSVLENFPKQSLFNSCQLRLNCGSTSKTLAQSSHTIGLTSQLLTLFKVGPFIYTVTEKNRLARYYVSDLNNKNYNVLILFSAILIVIYI